MGAHATDNRIGGKRVYRARQEHPQSYSWWDTQAKRFSLRTCPKCGNLCTQGSYVPPSLIRDNSPRECGIVENCLLCGWETVHIWGIGGEPLTWNDLNYRKAR